ncbi:hypothetical protein GE21DRAFT_4540 [Neurospora crassa]|uniref:Flavoprotein oxygenase n=1 Tax=Neurospora crassa (strain ATCC 24698 / 74-OR23-1A / CBS 708.71 / DSM 1257 / FGSC 987) TaxID=367110 RepID=Q7RZX5_NEUCR|nr:flavoprotein oxygenase [Neurospora crassa OR74A]EAA28471.2 flavoprotein oxygenase [Neurospora crassa OR74A]KHE89675.1 hypothetical protein GE21DRAFT_4540 [Neurospora crassa]|eukprot:XP_957707.2 flavoprotein oxygenase [Neurospora crassa OR74A]
MPTSKVLTSATNFIKPWTLSKLHHKHFPGLTSLFTKFSRSKSTHGFTNPAKMSTEPSAAEKSAAFEKVLKRNPHGDFKAVEASRPAFDPSPKFTYFQTPQPDWAYGSGANSLAASASAETKKKDEQQHIVVDPYTEGRPPAFNYKLLISAIVPRPIALVSTRSADGTTENLAPFSYFQVISHDPPLFTLGFASPLTPASRAKDSLRILHETGECVINLMSTPFLEAANSCSTNAPLGVSEWVISGLTPVYDTQTVKAARAKEAVFAVECKLVHVKEFESRSKPGETGSTLVVVEGTKFWIKEGAVNEELNQMDLDVYKPVSRLGGITYGLVREGLEIPRPDFEKDIGGMEGYEKLKKAREERKEKE